jgi:A/G-specific adenine glycosylase
MSHKVKIETGKKIPFFQDCLLSWYKVKGRHFPWRNPSATNYQKIISEVLLQRTKAETAARLFPHFLKKYPSWKKLGDATVEELEETLKPIGLQKQRAKRVFQLAQEMNKRKGRLPAQREEIQQIPMFGQYITNAILLLVYGEPAPLLDVNMSRLLERFFGPRQQADIRYDPYLQALTYRVVDHKESKIINWAILDYSALVCKARNPLCETCSLTDRCVYFKKVIK